MHKHVDRVEGAFAFVRLGDFVGAFGRPALQRTCPLDGSSYAVQRTTANPTWLKADIRQRSDLSVLQS